MKEGSKEQIYLIVGETKENCVRKRAGII